MARKRPAPMKGIALLPADTFTRPADTTAYASGDLVANNVTAGSVVPLSFAAGPAGFGANGAVKRVRLRKSGTGVTGASFRLHLYTASPTVANGDNGVWSTSGSATYLGFIDVTVDKAMTDGAVGVGALAAGNEMNFSTGTTPTLYGLLEARGAYTPASAEVFNATLDLLTN
jgi:hypothetical protein